MSAAESSTPLKVAIILGSVRKNRQTDRMAKPVLAALAARKHVVSVVVDPALPHYRWLATLEEPLHHQRPVRPEVQQLSEQLHAADFIVIISGEYNTAPSSTVLAILNNFHVETWGGKVAALVQYGGMAPGGARAASVLRGVGAELGLVVVPKQFTLQAPWSAISDEGHFVEPVKQKFLDALIDEAAQFSRLLNAHHGKPHH